MMKFNLYKNLPKQVGRNIRSYRTYQDMTQKDLGELIGVTKGAICQIEKGEVWTKMKNLAAIAEALNVPIYSLVVESQYSKEDMELFYSLAQKIRNKDVDPLYEAVKTLLQTK